MFQHNLILILRNFKRFKGTFYINLIGLSSGLACTLLIYLWVNDELSMDKFHEKDKRLFQVMQNFPVADGVVTVEATPGILGETLLRELPSVQDVATAASLAGTGETKGILSAGAVHVKADELYVSPHFFDVFSYQLIQGNKKLVLQDKYAVLLSDELARKLFGTTEDLTGRMVAWNQGSFSGPYTVAGVFAKPPRHSSAQFDLLFNYQLFLDKYPHQATWSNSGPSTYVVLKEGADAAALDAQLKDFIRNKFKAANGARGLETVGTLFLQRYSDKYLYNHFENGVQAGGRIDYVKLFSLIAVFILVIACVNFMNLSTAKATRRIKEIGIKKAIGADRKALVLQFLGESVLMAFIALVMAVLLVALLLPSFNRIMGKGLSLGVDPSMILSALGIALLTGLLSGSYPALYLSGFNPMVVLKGKLNPSTGEAWARKGLVVFQFTLSVILIVSVLVVYAQIEFVQSKNLGYDKANVISFANEGKLRESTATFLAEVKNLPGVVAASSFNHDLTGHHGGTPDIRWPGRDPGQKIQFEYMEVDYGLMEMMDFKMAQGRTFSQQFGTESNKIILNEAAVDAMGIADPVGKTVTLWGEDRQIMGVVQNFHFESLYQKVKPLLLLCSPNGRNVLVKVAAGRERETLDRLGKLYAQYNPGVPFEYTFLDADYQVLYAAESRVAVLSRYFAGMAMLISCLGLFGLAAFTTERRRKEVGIRKVLGASELGVIGLLSGEFIKMVGVSILIALPLSYLLANRWLAGFAYRIPMEPWYLAAAGGLALAVALGTVGTQALRAARVDPAQCLKEE